MSSEILYNEDELVNPDWMDKEFFEMVLRKSEEDDLLKISDFLISPASKKGDHYASLMYRIKINYFSSKTKSEEYKSIILKTEPYIDGIKKDKLCDKDIFNVEIKMYSETLPAIQELLLSIGDERNLTAKLLYHSRSPAKILIFEDISPYGFETAITFGVDDILSKLAFHRLGQMHAASMVLNLKSDSVSSYTKSMYDMDFCGEGFNFFCEFIQSLIVEVKTWPGYEMYAGMLDKATKTANIKGRKMVTANTPEEGYNVLNHGDFHSKNMMYKNMESNDAEIVMLDFQICFFASPAYDVLQGLYMIVNNESKEEFIKYYYEVFSSTLEKLEYSGKIPTFKDLQNELHKNRFYELLISIWSLPFCCPDIMMTINFNELFDFHGKSPEVRKSLYQNPIIQEKIKKLFPEFLKRGIFD